MSAATPQYADPRPNQDAPTMQAARPDGMGSNLGAQHGTAPAGERRRERKSAAHAKCGVRQLRLITPDPMTIHALDGPHDGLAYKK